VSPRPDPALEPLDDLDDLILRELAAVFGAADPVPTGLVEDIKFALTVQALHADVAELQQIGTEPMLVRSEYAQAHTLTFSAESVAAMITLTALSDSAVRIDGWVTGYDGPVTVEVRGVTTGTATTDEDGRFVLDDIDRGLVRFVFRPEGTDLSPVITPSVEI
jgi:hypothetical protein